MFDHVTIRVSGRDASERFYDTVLESIGIAKTNSGEHYAEWNDFSLAAATAEAPVTRRLHIGFLAPSREHVDEFWRVGVDAGYRDDGAPACVPSTRTTTTERFSWTLTATARRLSITTRATDASTTCGFGSPISRPHGGSTR